jgi:SAM-dependent methyltransferase
MKELLIGAGSNHDRRVQVGGREGWQDLLTLDINPAHKPDVVWDLANLPLPFLDNSFDEIHAYEVLEHVGQQGDWRFFFDQFADFWRILKPEGILAGMCPAWNSVWAWGDPSHTRVIQPEQFAFLNQRQYTVQVGKTAMSDFRHCYRADFEPTYLNTVDGTFSFVLQAIKPSRISI